MKQTSVQNDIQGWMTPAASSVGIGAIRQHQFYAFLEIFVKITGIFQVGVPTRIEMMKKEQQRRISQLVLTGIEIVSWEVLEHQKLDQISFHSQPWKQQRFFLSLKRTQFKGLTRWDNDEPRSRAAAAWCCKSRDEVCRRQRTEDATRCGRAVSRHPRETRDRSTFPRRRFLREIGRRDARASNLEFKAVKLNINANARPLLR